jgi:DNA polymerase
VDLWLDTETRSLLSLPQVGVFRYAPHASVMLNSWAIDDGEVRVEEKITPAFLDAFVAADRIIAHNAEFDRTILHHEFARAAKTALDGVDIRFDRWYCTMAQARRHGLPGSLDKLCEVLKVDANKAKMKDGRALVLLFCKPQKDGKWATKQTHPAEWARFVRYGGLDVVAMREVHRKCPKWNDAFDHPVWLADQRINARGFAVDVDFAAKAVILLKSESDRLDEEVQDATGYDPETGAGVKSARQRDALLWHLLSEHGVNLPDLAAETLERRLGDADLPDEVRNLLALRLQSSRTSTSKYTTIGRVTCDDGRARGTTTYCGAMRTKRWAGNRFQPHNLPRPAVGKLRGAALKKTIANAIHSIKAGVFDIACAYPLPEVAASAIRGCVVPARGKKLVVGDYSNVEGRGLAWLAGEEWKLQAFRDFDAGVGPDLYKVAYAAAFDVDVDDVDDGVERQVGKVMELMLGYGGGVGAFVTGAETYKVDLDELVLTAWPKVPEDVREETAGMWEWAVRERRTLGLPEMTFRVCDALKRMWRRRHPKIVAFWGDLEQGFAHVASGTVRSAQIGLLRIDKVGAWVRIGGPAGDFISYPGAQVAPNGTLRYLGQNQYTRTWGYVSTYGGKLAENVTQWLCRDLLAESMLNAESIQLPLVLHVHDEDIAEVDDNYASATEDLQWCMTHVPWAAGMPLAVAAHETDRYAKE